MTSSSRGGLFALFPLLSLTSHASEATSSSRLDTPHAHADSALRPLVHSDMHALFTAETDASMFNPHGLYMPPKNFAYSPKEMTACCKNRCLTAAMLPGSRKSCLMGCELWMHKSSLNWAGRQWHPKLEKQCQRDCTAVDKWDKHLAKYDRKHRDHNGDLTRLHPGWRATLSTKPVHAAAWSTISPSDAHACEGGCTRFRACLMQSYPKEDRYPYTIFPNSILNHKL